MYLYLCAKNILKNQTEKETSLFSFAEIIDMAVQIEKNGERIYQAAIHHTNDEGLKEMLQWMADEESSHAAWFGKLAEKDPFIPDDASLKEMSDALVRDYLKDQAFSLKDVDFSAVANTDELIGIFIEFEKDTILFYDLLVAFVPDEAIKTEIRAIIKEEETHAQKLRALISSPLS
jgi:rubrerythrin